MKGSTEGNRQRRLREGTREGFPERLMTELDLKTNDFYGWFYEITRPRCLCLTVSVKTQAQGTHVGAMRRER